MPKGVVIENRSVVELICWALGTMEAADLAGVLASTSICFDLSAFEIYVPLSCGGTVILVDSVLRMFDCASLEKVSLVNTMGQIIFTEELCRKGINRYKLDVSPGAYMVRITAPGILHTGKVIVK